MNKKNNSTLDAHLCVYFIFCFSYVLLWLDTLFNSKVNHPSVTKGSHTVISNIRLNFFTITFSEFYWWKLVLLLVFFFQIFIIIFLLQCIRHDFFTFIIIYSFYFNIFFFLYLLLILLNFNCQHLETFLFKILIYIHVGFFCF